MTTPTTHDVPIPAGAIAVANWDDVEHGAEHTHRYFRGSSWVVERDEKDICVMVDGIQRLDGRVKREITVAEGDTEALDALAPDQARQLGQALIAAADEADRMNGYDRIEVTR